MFNTNLIMPHDRVSPPSIGYGLGIAVLASAAAAVVVLCRRWRLASARRPGGSRSCAASISSRSGLCTDCHTPGYFFGKPDQARYLGGSEVGFHIPDLGVFHGPNLTPDDETGLGRWSADDIVKAIQTGARPDGRVLAPIMPWHAFAQLTREDAYAIASFLKSLPPGAEQGARARSARPRRRRRSCSKSWRRLRPASSGRQRKGPGGSRALRFSRQAGWLTSCRPYRPCRPFRRRRHRRAACRSSAARRPWPRW